jgi:hypothetical protein
MGAMLYGHVGSVQSHILPRPRQRFGGPRRKRPSAPRPGVSAQDHITGDLLGSHMPLDIDLHWQWSNPLNLLPMTLALMLVLALVTMMAR